MATAKNYLLIISAAYTVDNHLVQYHYHDSLSNTKNFEEQIIVSYYVPTRYSLKFFFNIQKSLEKFQESRSSGHVRFRQI